MLVLCFSAAYEFQLVAFFRQPDVIDKINRRYRRGVRPQLREALDDIKANGISGLERVQLSGGTAAYELALILRLMSYPFICQVFLHECLIIYSSFYPSYNYQSSIFPSIITYPFIHPFFQPFTYLPHSSIHLSIYSVHLQCIHSFTYMYLSIHPSIHLSIHSFIHLSIHSSIYPFIHLSIHSSIYPFIHLSIYYVHYQIFFSSIFEEEINSIQPQTNPAPQIVGMYMYMYSL